MGTWSELKQEMEVNPAVREEVMAGLCDLLREAISRNALPELNSALFQSDEKFIELDMTTDMDLSDEESAAISKSLVLAIGIDPDQPDRFELYSCSGGDPVVIPRSHLEYFIEALESQRQTGS